METFYYALTGWRWFSPVLSQGLHFLRGRRFYTEFAFKNLQYLNQNQTGQSWWRMHGSLRGRRHSLVQNGQIRQAENAGLGLKHTDSSGVKRMDPSSEECMSWCRTYKSIRWRRHWSMVENNCWPDQSDVIMFWEEPLHCQSFYWTPFIFSRQREVRNLSYLNLFNQLIKDIFYYIIMLYIQCFLIQNILGKLSSNNQRKLVGGIFGR